MFSEEMIKSYEEPSMKVVNFHGVSLRMNGWIRYIAMDESGCIYGYDFEPSIFKDKWVNIYGNTRYLGMLTKGEFTNWEETLVKLDH